MREASEVRDVLTFCSESIEKGQLNKTLGEVEFYRTKEIIARYLSKDKKQVIYCIGGKKGAYANWLAQMGHEVHFFDVVPEHITYASTLQSEGAYYGVKAFELCEARAIQRMSASADLVLLMEPLCYLMECEQRLAAIKEAKRLLKKDGMLITSGISRFSSTLWGLSVYGENNKCLGEDAFCEMIDKEIAEGQHIRPVGYEELEERAFFYLPGELWEEIEVCGMDIENIFAVEGPILLVHELEEKWQNENDRERLMQLVKKVEMEEDIMGMSPHLLAIAKR